MFGFILPVMLDMTMKVGTKPTNYSSVNCRKSAGMGMFEYIFILPTVCYRFVVAALSRAELCIPV